MEVRKVKRGGRGKERKGEKFTAGISGQRQEGEIRHGAGEGWWCSLVRELPG